MKTLNIKTITIIIQTIYINNLEFKNWKRGSYF